MLATCVIQPIDMIKVQLGQGSPVQVTKNMIANEGFSSLYKVYDLTILKGLKHRLAAGGRLPNIIILLPVEKKVIKSGNNERTINFAGRLLPHTIFICELPPRQLLTARVYEYLLQFQWIQWFNRLGGCSHTLLRSCWTKKYGDSKDWCLIWIVLCGKCSRHMD